MIVKMMHLDLVCVAAEREATLEKLRELGAVHLDLSAAQGAGVAAAKGEAADAETAVRLILKAREGEKEENEIRPRTVADVLAIEADRETLRGAVEELTREIRIYEPYGDFDPKLAQKLLDAGVDVASVAELPETLPAMRLSRMQEKLRRVENRLNVDTAKIAGSDEKAILAKYPALADKIAFEQAAELMKAEGAVAVVSGWIPETKVQGLRSKVRSEGWGVLIREPAEGETPPTLIEPPKMFRPMKALFAGLGISPAYTEADVSVPFMCYFTLFFAMLVGDGAYGAIFLLGTLLMRKKLPKSWLILMSVFSCATIAWGFLSNTWFGEALPFAKDWPTVVWLGDVTYRNMMLLCFTIGVSHLMLARVWSGLCKLNDSTCLAEFGWAGVLLFMYFVTNSLVGIFDSVPAAMTWVFCVSLALVFLFSVKPKDLKRDGIALGMLPLNIMSALGDIISYVRLFAIGLASVKVAENFNSMAVGLLSADQPLWLNAILFLGTAAILLVGHALNLAMAALSILVHAVRLNTLEFSNHKGVTWSGYAFSPFRKADRG